MSGLARVARHHQPLGMRAARRAADGRQTVTALATRLTLIQACTRRPARGRRAMVCASGSKLGRHAGAAARGSTHAKYASPRPRTWTNSVLKPAARRIVHHRRSMCRARSATCAAPRARAPRARRRATRGRARGGEREAADEQRHEHGSTPRSARSSPVGHRRAWTVAAAGSHCQRTVRHRRCVNNTHESRAAGHDQLYCCRSWRRREPRRDITSSASTPAERRRCACWRTATAASSPRRAAGGANLQAAGELEVEKVLHDVMERGHRRSRRRCRRPSASGWPASIAMTTRAVDARA